MDWNLVRILLKKERLGRTLYRYVDWNSCKSVRFLLCPVVPYIGTWIETTMICKYPWIRFVVPYIGTWIETPDGGYGFYDAQGRTLYRYVDWNQPESKIKKYSLSRTLYRYVDWNLCVLCGRTIWIVVPYIGTWIETPIRSIVPKRAVVVPYIGTWIETIIQHWQRSRI